MSVGELHIPPVSREAWADLVRRRSGGGDRWQINDAAELPNELLTLCQPDDTNWIVDARQPNFIELLAGDHLHIQLRGELYSLAAPSEPGNAWRTIKTAEGYAHHHKLFLPEALQGERRGRRLIRYSAGLYKALGVDRITLNAERVGKYAWGRMGFTFEDEDMADEVHAAAQAFARDLGMSDAFPSFRHPWQYAALDFGPDGARQRLVPAAVINELLAHRYARYPIMPPEQEGDLPLSKTLLLWAPYDQWRGVLPLSREQLGFERMLDYTQKT